jgi:peptidoglycan/LPS O-acetylase OafA/YrhL
MISNRIYQLDALRGLAAFTVVIHHCLLVFPAFLAAHFHKETTSTISAFTYSPLHILWAGHEAVILFFVLSGFVLSIPYFNGQALHYGNYLLKRICRLYIPYIISLCFSAVFLKILSEYGVSGLSKWFNDMWHYFPNLSDWLHLIFMTDADTHNINTVTWSLLYEMKISIIFPLIVYLTKKMNWKVMIILFILTAVHKSQTVHYLSFFIAGCLLAKHQYFLSSYISNAPRIFSLILTILGLSLYLIEWLVPIHLNSNLLDMLVGIGSSIFIVLSLGDTFVKKMLLLPRLVYLGRISYSLYLVHPIVLLIAIYSLKQFFPIYIIVLFVPLISIFIAHYYNKIIENPSIKLSRKFSYKTSMV